MNKDTIFYTVLAVTLIGTVFYATQDNLDEFSAWKTKYGMKFNQAEDVYRSMIFHRNLDIIKSHNHNKDRTYDMGVNQFTGLTDQQFASTYLTPKKYDPEWENVDVETQTNGLEVDWTTKGAVSRVKNQGSCGSCWAFSAVGTLESWALLNNRQVDLSEQQLVDCSGKYGNAGCNGGYNYQGLAYVKDHGITDQNSYPYVAKTQHCQKEGGDFKINSVQSARGCDALVTAISARPVGVSADATNWSKYSSGVFTNCSTHLNHDILLVGVSDGYWKIKNSWGTGWGESGFIRLARGNTCGICQDKSPWPQ